MAAARRPQHDSCATAHADELAMQRSVEHAFPLKSNATDETSYIVIRAHI